MDEASLSQRSWRSIPLALQTQTKGVSQGAAHQLSPTSAGGVRSHLKAPGDNKRQETGCAEPVCGATGWLPSRWLLKQGVLLAQPYLMLQAVCFREQGLERCCSRSAFASAFWLRAGALLFSLLCGKGTEPRRV